MRYSPAILLGAATVAVAQNAAFQKYPDCKNGPLAKIKVCDTTLSPPERAAALVAALTNEEKLQNLVRCVNSTPLSTAKPKNGDGRNETKSGACND